MTQSMRKSQIFLHNTDTNEDVIVNNVKIEKDEMINENGDVYKILSREYKRSKVRYNVQLKMKNTVGGCGCQDQLVHQAYRKFIESLNPEDQQGFRELLTGQPDIDDDLIDANYTNPEIRQKFKQSGIASTHLDLTDKQKTDLIFGKARRSRNYNMISAEQLKISEKYFNIRPDDLQDIRNQSLLTQIKQQVNEEDDQPQKFQGGHRFVENNEYEEIDMDGDQILEPQADNTTIAELTGQARKKSTKKHKYNKIYYSSITLDDDVNFLTTGVHNFKFRTFRMKQNLTDEDQQQLELFDDLKQSVLSQPIPGSEIQGQGRKARRRHFNQPMNEEPDQIGEDEEIPKVESAQPVQEVQEEQADQNAQNDEPTQNPDVDTEDTGDISVFESSTSEGTSEGTSDNTSEGTSEYTSEEQEMPKQQLYKRLLHANDDEDSFELI